MTGDEFARRIGHAFADPQLLESALTHASAARERDGSGGNERLEFLGDAVLDLVISRALFEAHPDWPEGRLSRTRAALVNGKSLAARASELALGDAMVLGRSEMQTGGADKPSILANVFEAVVAALYLDGGLDAVERFVRERFPEAFDPDAPPSKRDPKTRLNEWAHASGHPSPRYERIDDSGEQEDDERIAVAVSVGDVVRARARGANRRVAERRAAAKALEAAGVD